MSFAADAARWVAELLAVFPDWLVVVLVAMMPVAELRGAIPLGIFYYDMPWALVFALALFGNIAIVPLIWWVLRPAERLLRRVPAFDRLLTRLFEHTRRRTRKRVETYQELALFIFVAVPLPGTGAWTGALVAYLFDLPRHKSLWVIALGVFTAGLIVLALVGGGIGLFGGA